MPKSIVAVTNTHYATNASSTFNDLLSHVDLNTLKQALGTSSSWFFDFGCCNHMTANNCLFKHENSVSYPYVIQTVDNSCMFVSHIGGVSTSNLSLPNTFLVPKLSLNLISVGQLCDLGLDLHFSRTGCYIQDPQTG